MLKKRNKRGPRSTSSEKWRTFYAPYVLKVIDGLVNVDEVEEIYALHLFMYSQSNLERIVQNMNSNLYQKAFRVGILPIGFEEQDNEIGNILFVLSKEDVFLVIVYEDERQKDFNLTLKHWEKISNKLDITQFPFRRLVYPI